MPKVLAGAEIPDRPSWRLNEDRFVTRVLLPLVALQVVAILVLGDGRPQKLLTAINVAPTAALAVYCFGLIRNVYRKNRESHKSPIPV